LKGSGLSLLQKVIPEVEQFELIDDGELTTAHYPLLMHAKRLNSQLRLGTFFNQPPDWIPIHLAQQQAMDWAEQLDIAVVDLNFSLIAADYC
jgi:hypothetical protein